MIYSSALFAGDGAAGLDAAAAAKIGAIAQRLDLCAGDRVLEIGCGWGTLAADLPERTA